MRERTELEDDARLLLLRADRLRRAPPAPGSAQRYLAEFPSAGGRYAVPLAALRGALPLRLLRPVPGSPAYLIGLLLFQGELVSVLSLASLIGVGGWRQDPSTLLLLESREKILYGVDCEAIPRVVEIDGDEYERALGSALAAGRAEVAIADGSSLTLLDLSTLLEHVRERGDAG